MSPVWQEFLISQGADFEADRLLNFPDSETRTIDNIVTDLSHLALLEISGDDAEDFLHGQFTINIYHLPEYLLKFSAWCNPKGQVRATFFIYRHDDGFTILLPAGLKESFVKQLQMYILRSDVQLLDKSDEIIRIGLNTENTALLVGLIDSDPERQGDVIKSDTTIYNDLHYLRIASQGDEKNTDRYILIGSVDKQITLWKELVKYVTPVGTSVWELLDIQAAYPWITTQTTQKFLPQILNMDLIDGLDYQKGCYPGQEIIARLHFRGQLKCSIHLATCALESCPESGNQILVKDKQIVGTVINAQASQDEFYLLAVIDNDSIENKLSLRSPGAPELSLHRLPYGKK